MSLSALVHAWSVTGVTRSERLLLLALGDMANHRGICWPSIKHLEKKALMSDRQVQVCLKSLVDKGALERSIGAGPFGTNGYLLLGLEIRCVYCNALATELDHYVPKSKGGSDEKSNLVPACHDCNMRKRDKLPADFDPPKFLHPETLGVKPLRQGGEDLFTLTSQKTQKKKKVLEHRVLSSHDSMEMLGEEAGEIQEKYPKLDFAETLKMWVSWVEAQGGVQIPINSVRWWFKNAEKYRLEREANMSTFRNGNRKPAFDNVRGGVAPDAKDPMEYLRRYEHLSRDAKEKR